MLDPAPTAIDAVPAATAADGATGEGGGDAGGHVEFGVLGPLRIARRGRELALTSPRSRVFLAHLVLAAGRQVSLYAFADGIWGADLPKNPRRAVQLVAVRVRAQLDRLGAGDLVVTCPDGYRLDVPAERTDLGRVDALLGRADEAAANGDDGGELAAVSEALGLWRGEPLVDVPSDDLQREAVPGLRERRLQLVERRVDVLLRTGDAADLVDELVGLAARHPLREGLTERLMRALHKSGRRGEALDAYHRFRRRLGDELGIEPGEEIRALHAAILTDRADGERAAARLPVPRQLPAGVAAFAGRTAELARLDDLLSTVDASAGPVVAVVTGTAGVGKSTLAVRWARRVADEFADGQLFADLRGYHPGQALSAPSVQARILRTLGVRGADIPADDEELTALYRSTLHGRRLLMVLDNADSADHVRPLLPSGAGCLVLVTSRDVLLSLIATHGAHRISLDLFSPAEARELLVRRLGPERLAVEPRAADDIVAASARLPLALSIAAARAVIDRHAPLGDLAAQLREGLDAFDTASDLTDVRAVFSWSYRALSPDAARLLRLLGLHPGPQATAPAAASLAGIPQDRTERLLDELVRAHLVVEHVPGRYVLHALMREYTAELVRTVDTAHERDAAARRVIDHYLHTANAAAALVNPMLINELPGRPLPDVGPEPIADAAAALDWFHTEQDVLLAVLDWAAALGRDRQVWDLVRVVAEYFERQSDWAHWAGSLQLALAAAERLDDPARQAKAHRWLARMHVRVARFEEAEHHLALALDLHRHHDNPSGEAHVESDAAILHEQQGRFPQALEHALRALELHRRLPPHPGYVGALNTVAWCYARVGEYRKSIEYGREALAEVRAMGAPAGELVVLDTLGYAQHHLGEHAEAVASYGRAIEVAREVGDRFNLAMTLGNLGDTYEAMADPIAALEMWRQAAGIFEELEHPAVRPMREKIARLAG